MDHTDPFLFDKRIIERNIKLGKATRQEFEGYLKALPDRSSLIDLERGDEDDAQE